MWMNIFRFIKKFKKIIIYIIILFVIIKCGSIVFQEKVEQTMSEDDLKELPIAYKEFNYGDYTTIKLLHISTGEVEEIPRPGTMPPRCRKRMRWYR